MSTTFRPRYTIAEQCRIAATISDQIGYATYHLLGIDKLTSGETEEGPFLKFKVKGSKKCNWIMVHLTPLGEYTVVAHNTRRKSIGDPTEVDRSEHACAEDLHEVLERLTGLFAHF